jgi:hypothetical protein
MRNLNDTNGYLFASVVKRAAAVVCCLLSVVIVVARFVEFNFFFNAPTGPTHHTRYKIEGQYSSLQNLLALRALPPAAASAALLLPDRCRCRLLLHRRPRRRRRGHGPAPV